MSLAFGVQDNFTKGKIVKINKRKALIISIVMTPFIIISLILLAGTIATYPSKQKIIDLPNDLNGQTIEFNSQSGAKIKGWFIIGNPKTGVIILMHGVRASRVSMIERARFLSKEGYSVLLFDFQAHGESTGEQITFGYLESKDAQAAVNFIKNRFPDKKIGIIGVSMGGAATILAEPKLNVDAMVLELVYPTIEEAIGNRFSMKLGKWSEIFTPLLLTQIKPRLGITADDLKPIDKVKEIRIPKLFIAGELDKHTRQEQSIRLFENASNPKELWIVKGAKHWDMHSVVKREYESKVLKFFENSL